METTDFSDLRTWKYIVATVLTEKDGIGQYLDEPFTEEVAKKLQKRFGNIEQKLIDEIKRRKELLSSERKKENSSSTKLSLGGRIAELEELLVFANEMQGEQKPVDEIQSTMSQLSRRQNQEWKEHDEMIRKVNEAFRHSLEEFFSDHPEFLPKRKLHWRFPPPM